MWWDRGEAMRLSQDLLDREVTVSVPEAASILGISRSLGYQLVADGEIPSIKVGKRIIVPTEALRAMLRTVAPASSSNAAVPTTRRHTR